MRMTDSKDTNLIVRVSETQKRQIEAAATRSGLTVADYVRTILTISTQSRTLGSWVDRLVVRRRHQREGMK